MTVLMTIKIERLDTGQIVCNTDKRGCTLQEMIIILLHICSTVGDISKMVQSLDKEGVFVTKLGDDPNE